MFLKKIVMLIAGFGISIAFHYFLTVGYFLYLELVTRHATFKISEFRGSFLKVNGIALAGAALVLIALSLFRKDRLNQKLVRDIPAVFCMVNGISVMSLLTSSIFPYQNLPWVMHLSVLLTVTIYFFLSIYRGVPFYKERISIYLKDQTLGVPIIDIREVMSQNRKNRLWIIGILAIIVLIPVISKTAYDREEGYLFLSVYLLALLIAVFEMTWLSTALLTSIVHSRFSPEIREIIDIDGRQINSEKSI